MTLNQLKKNWARALTDVCASIGGTLGVVMLIAFIVSLQPNEQTASASFASYFQGGQIGLPILSLSGVVLLALVRGNKKPHPVFAFVLSAIVLLSAIGTAFSIGLNPGFAADRLGPQNLDLLWSFYGLLHLLWFFALIAEPSIPSPQEAAEEQESRVEKIKQGATRHA